MTKSCTRSSLFAFALALGAALLAAAMPAAAGESWTPKFNSVEDALNDELPAAPKSGPKANPGLPEAARLKVQPGPPEKALGGPDTKTLGGPDTKLGLRGTDKSHRLAR